LFVCLLIKKQWEVAISSVEVRCIGGVQNVFFYPLFPSKKLRFHHPSLSKISISIIIIIIVIINDTVNFITQNDYLRKREIESKILMWDKCNSTILLIDVEFLITTSCCENNHILRILMANSNTDQFSHFVVLLIT
jgi:hypothetical protein